MGKIENLRPPTDREVNRKAGVASGIARRKKRDLKKALETLLASDTIDPETGKSLSGAELMAVTAFRAAVKGDWEAWKLARDTSGQKPVEKAQVKTTAKPVVIIGADQLED